MDKSNVTGAEQGERCIAAGIPLVCGNVEPAFDETTALSRLDDDHAFLNQLAVIFVEESPGLIAEIRTAIEQQDGRRLHRAAHKLKGSSFPFCAAAVTDVLQSLESIGESGQMAAATAEQPRFETEIARLITALNAFALLPDRQNSPNPNIISGPEPANPCTA